MDGAGAKTLDGLHVGGGAVALVLGEAVTGIEGLGLLHQVVTGNAAEPRVWADIGDFLAAKAREPWRCHFHVPIFLDRVGGLRTTADGIEATLRRVIEAGHAPFMEVETYAWQRLPETAAPSLEEGLAREILHARALLAKCASNADAAHR